MKFLAFFDFVAKSGNEWDFMEPLICGILQARGRSRYPCKKIKHRQTGCLAFLKKKFDIEVTAEMEEELRTMCNLSEGIYERGVAQGITQGEENKTIDMIRNLWRKGMDVAFIKDVTNWTEEQIMQVVDQYKH